jgi:hypothetical protein
MMNPARINTLAVSRFFGIELGISLNAVRHIFFLNSDLSPAIWASFDLVSRISRETDRTRW